MPRENTLSSLLPAGQELGRTNVHLMDTYELWIQSASQMLR